MKQLRILFTFAAIFYFAHSIQAQKASSAYFKLPSHVSARDYQHNKILVKLKKENRHLNPQQIIDDLQKKLPVKTFSSVLNENIQKKLAARAEPLSSDIDRIYEVQLPPGTDVEEAINLAYSTGYFEVVEPAYIFQSFAAPNDEKLGEQYYLQMIRAIEAWELNEGSEEIIIAIVDAGVDLKHPDLKDRIFYNENDPIDGIDNDNDGYIDNYAGWDFVGSYHNNPIPDNDPAIYSANVNHGTLVAGLVAATGNNQKGIAGVSFKSKIMVTKHSGDDKPVETSSVVEGYEGVIYAANHGADIINCSWGGPFYSRIAEDIIKYVVEDMNVVVVAAAGNENTNFPIYPAAFKNVLSVTAVDDAGLVTPFSNFGPSIDLAAPGIEMISTDYNGKYKKVSGTSFAAPLAAGAAALVRSQYPALNARQVIELLRVSADPSIYDHVTNPKNQLGKGLLDVAAALSKQMPSVRLSNLKVLNKYGHVAQAGDTAYVYADFTNYLWRSSSMLKARLLMSNQYITILQQEISLGRIEQQATINNQHVPFILYIEEEAEENIIADLVFRFYDGEYQDIQYTHVNFNPGYLAINENQISTVVASNGRLGYYDYYDNAMGRGFVVNGKNTLFEMGLIMGNAPNKIINNVRRLPDSADVDFLPIQKIREHRPGKYSAYELTGQFSDENAGSSQLGVLVDYRSMVWQESPRDKFVILEYKIRNNSSFDINNFHTGIFADWDISDRGQADHIEYNADHRLGIAYNGDSDERIYTGVQALTGPAGAYTSQNSFLYDGFSDAEKFIAISTQFDAFAGNTDISQVVWQGPFDIPVDAEVTIAFAIHGTTSYEEIINSAIDADSMYNYTLKAPVPQVVSDTVCYGGGTVLIASGAGQFHWYNAFTGGAKIGEGSSIAVADLRSDTILYVANADQSYQSVRAPAFVRVKANPEIIVLGETTFCEGDSVILMANEADTYLWNTGSESQKIVVKAAGIHSVSVTDNQLACQSTTGNAVETSILPNASANFTVSSEFTFKDQDIAFENLSTSAQKYYWNFGDGNTSLLEDPVHQYSLNNGYEVNLTAIHTNGCSHTFTRILEVVTGTSEQMAGKIKVYPNPAFNDEVFLQLPQAFGQKINIQIINLRGSSLNEFEMINSGTIRIDLSAYVQENVLIIRIYSQEYQAAFRILKWK